MRFLLTKVEKEIFFDKEGKKERIVFQNEVIEESSVELSQWYIDNVLIPNQATGRERTKRIEKEMKIALKLREIAEKELEKEENN